MINNCCQNCPNRSVACHTDCEKYLKAVSDNNARLKARHLLQVSAAIGNQNFINNRIRQNAKSRGYGRGINADI